MQVLNKQVEDVTGGTVSQSMMNTALSIGVACAVMLSMVRVLTGISIYWILVPGYALALILARFVPSVFVGIAFDSGGVASGPMTSTFLLPHRARRQRRHGRLRRRGARRARSAGGDPDHGRPLRT